VNKLKAELRKTGYMQVNELTKNTLVEKLMWLRNKAAALIKIQCDLHNVEVDEMGVLKNGVRTIPKGFAVEGVRMRTEATWFDAHMLVPVHSSGSEDSQAFSEDSQAARDGEENPEEEERSFDSDDLRAHGLLLSDDEEAAPS
jgi:hypothetical protein